MFVSFKNSYVEILNLKIMVWGGKAFGRYLSHKGRALMNGINALSKRTHKELAPSTCVGMMWRRQLWMRKALSSKRDHAGALILLRSKCLLLPSQWYFVMAARTD